MFVHRIDDDRWLRLGEEVDAAELRAVADANRALLATWMPWASDETPEATLEFIRLSRRQFIDHQSLQTLIVERDAIVGTAGLHRVDWANRSASVGYWLARSAQGRGTVTLAVRALLDHAFGFWKLNRVELRAGVDNRPSRAVAERLGFTLEGVLRQAERFADGRFVDHALYAMLAADWESGRAGT